MNRDHIFFTWPDSTFTYDCTPCGACCKGLGIGLDNENGQTQELLSLYPDITPFVRKRGLAWTIFNPRGRCWFLADDGLCTIEVEHGRATKPGACRLFPFNRIFRIGPYMIVDYNSVICPLQPTTPDRRNTGITHESVLADIEAVSDAALVGTRLPANQPEQEGKRLVTRERHIASACFREADADAPSIEAPWRAQSKDGIAHIAIERISHALHMLVGQTFSVPDTTTIRTALWLTPSMRFNELYGPRTYDTRTELSSVLPDIWLAWLHFLGQGAKLCGHSLDMRAATTIWSAQIPLAYLAARWNRAPTLEPGEYELPGADDADSVIRSFAQACIDNRNKRTPLSQILGPLLEPYQFAERVALARLAEPLFGAIRWRKRR